MYGGVSGRLGWKQVYIAKPTYRQIGMKGHRHMYDLFPTLSSDVDFDKLAHSSPVSGAWRGVAWCGVVWRGVVC